MSAYTVTINETTQLVTVASPGPQGPPYAGKIVTSGTLDGGAHNSTDFSTLEGLFIDGVVLDGGSP